MNAPPIQMVYLIKLIFPLCVVASNQVNSLESGTLAVGINLRNKSSRDWQKNASSVILLSATMGAFIKVVPPFIIRI